jgi:hypothetical protein
VDQQGESATWPPIAAHGASIRESGNVAICHNSAVAT